MLGVDLGCDAHLKRLKAELDRVDPAEVDRLAELIYEAYQNGRFVFIFGNGGSACLASHLAEDLGKGAFREEDLAGPCSFDASGDAATARFSELPGLAVPKDAHHRAGAIPGPSEME